MTGGESLAGVLWAFYQDRVSSIPATRGLEKGALFQPPSTWRSPQHGGSVLAPPTLSILIRNMRDLEMESNLMEVAEGRGCSVRRQRHQSLYRLCRWWIMARLCGVGRMWCCNFWRINEQEWVGHPQLLFQWIRIEDSRIWKD